MTAQHAYAIRAIVSLRKELRLIFVIVGAMLCMPVLIVLLLTQVGVAAVSAAFVSPLAQNGQVAVRDPTTGVVTAYLSSPRVWPIGGVVTLEFGAPDPPFQPAHTGIDIASPHREIGDPVVAFMSGTVVYSGFDNLGLGNHVIIDHGNHVRSLYGHLDSLAVAVGKSVDAGTIIGRRGSTGWSTGPHLHFQINVSGIPVNPRSFLGGNP